MNYRLVPKLSLSYLAATLSPLTANPIDPTPTVVTGQVEFAGLDTHSAVITQSTQKAIVDYSHFNIPEGSSVQFIQPNAESALLNRISGADPSVLNGSLTANGQIYFVNPAGVTFGRNAVIRADVFMAAAGQISNADFLNNTHNFSLSGNVINHGSIQTENGVGLFGQQVENTGEIVAKKGYAIVASGDEVHVRQGGTGLAVDVTESAKATQAGNGIRNMGTVDGEDIMFSAGDAFATAIQQSGKVTARRSAKIHSDGGKVEVSGEITARNEAGQGGRIEVGGTDMGADTAPSSSSTTIAASAVLDASSDLGKGGHIVVWSDGHTQFSGVADATSRSGEGGFIEASGKTIEFANIADNILLNSGGHFLLDPEDITIDASLASGIETDLNDGVSVTLMTDSAIAGNGDITVEADIRVPKNNANKKGVFSLIAHRDIIVNEGVIIQNFQEDFAPGETVFSFYAGGDIELKGELKHTGNLGEKGRGSIFLTAVGGILIDDVEVDAGGGSIVINANRVDVAGGGGALVAGTIGVLADAGRIDVTAATEFKLAGGGRIQTYGGTDVFIDSGLFTNGTGASALSIYNRAESFFAIHLPDPSGDGLGGNHQYNNTVSGNRALFDVDDLDFSRIKASGISNNRFYYNFQPTVNITAKSGVKTYGNTFILPAGGSAVTVDSSGFVQPPTTLNRPFEPDTIANLNLSGVTTTSTGAVITANAGGYDINATGATSDNGYNIAYSRGILTVDPRSMVITASPQSKQYGDVLPLDGSKFTVADQGNPLDSTLPNGNSITSVDLLSIGGIDSSTTAGVMSYPNEIEITDQIGTGGFNKNNYAIQYVKGALAVNRRDVTITASEQSKFYGDILDLNSNVSRTAFTVEDKGLTLKPDGSLPNEEVIDTVTLQSVLPVNVAESVTEPVGTYLAELRPFSVQGSGPTFSVNNYTFKFVEGNLEVVPRPITLTPTNQVKEYGEVLPLGTTAFTVLDRGLTNGNDAFLPNGERIATVSLISSSGIAASTDADVNTYENNISIDRNLFSSANGTGGFNASNYEIDFATGNLAIDPRQIQLTASRQEKFYGDFLILDNGAFTIIDQGNELDSTLPNGENITAVVINSATGVDSSTDSNADLYSNEIVISGPVTGTPGTGDGFLESNYDITYVEGNLLVKPRPIQVSAVQQEKIYGNTLTLDPTAFTVTDTLTVTDLLVGGGPLPNGEQIDTVNIISRGGHDASTMSSALPYVDDLEVTSVATSSNNFELGNYSIDFSNLANFVINRRAVTLTALQQEKDYGDVHTLDTTAFSVTDLDDDSILPNGEVISNVTIVSADGIAASTDADVALYEGNLSITPTETGAPTLSGSNGFDQENYAFSYETGNFVINKRAITLTASQQEKIYGNILSLDDTAFTTNDRDGGPALPNGEIVTNVTINSASGIDASTSANVLTYDDEIVISGPVSGTPGTGDGFLESNYDITYVEGKLKINKRPITLTATLQDKVYGESVDASTTALTVTDLNGGGGLPNGETINSVNIVSALPGDSQAPVGVYPDELVPTNILTSSPTFDEANYDITRVNGEYIIRQRAILLTALDQGKVYGDVDSLNPTSFTVTDIYGGGGSTLPNNEAVSTVAFDPTSLPGDTTAPSGLYSDEIVISNQSGSNGFLASNYDISYAPGDYTIGRRSIELVINDDKRYAGAAYQIDPTAFVTIDLDSDNMLPNGESVDSLLITSLTGVAENPAAPMGVYPGELTADPLSAVGSNGFDLENYSVTVTPGEFEIEPFPGLAAIGQDIYIEQWIRDNIGYDPEDPFKNSYAISQSLGVRILSLDWWADLSPSKKQSVLSALDAIPLHLQTLDLAKRLIDQVK